MIFATTCRRMFSSDLSEAQFSHIAKRVADYQAAGDPVISVDTKKIEHRMFCHITANWRGRPLISREVVVNLIGSTTTLHIKAVLDENTYAPGIKVSDEELATLVIEPDEFHGEWNYRLRPRDLHV